MLGVQIAIFMPKGNKDWTRKCTFIMLCIHLHYSWWICTENLPNDVVAAVQHNAQQRLQRICFFSPALIIWGGMKGNRKHIRQDNHAIIGLTLRVIRIRETSQHILLVVWNKDLPNLVSSFWLSSQVKIKNHRNDTIWHTFSFIFPVCKICPRRN